MNPNFTSNPVEFLNTEDFGLKLKFSKISKPAVFLNVDDIILKFKFLKKPTNDYVFNILRYLDLCFPEKHIDVVYLMNHIIDFERFLLINVDENIKLSFFSTSILVQIIKTPDMNKEQMLTTFYEEKFASLEQVPSNVKITKYVVHVYTSNDGVIIKSIKPIRKYRHWEHTFEEMSMEQTSRR